MAFHNLVKLSKYTFETFQLTCNLAVGVVAADVGKAVSQDTSADNQVKLAGAGEAIVGSLYTVEPRVNEGTNIGTVEFKFATKFTIKTGLTGNQVVARGSRICGAGAGEIRALDPAVTGDAILIADGAPRVWAVIGTTAVCTNF